MSVQGPQWSITSLCLIKNTLKAAGLMAQEEHAVPTAAFHVRL